MLRIKRKLILVRVNEIIVAAASFTVFFQLSLGNFTKALVVAIAFTVVFVMSGMTGRALILWPLVGTVFWIVWLTEGRFYSQRKNVNRILIHEPVSHELENAWTEAMTAGNSHSD